MVDICCEELVEIDIKINERKSQIIRIRPLSRRFYATLFKYYISRRSHKK